jgi:hypothetical protein
LGQQQRVGQVLEVHPAIIRPLEMYENVEPTQPDAGLALDLILESLENSSMGFNKRFPDLATVVLMLAARLVPHTVSLW